MIKTEPDHEEAGRVCARFEEIARQAGGSLSPRKLGALMAAALRRVVEIETGKAEGEPLAWALDENHDPIERDEETQQYLREAGEILDGVPNVSDEERARMFATLAEAARLALSGLGYKAKIQKRDS